MKKLRIFLGFLHFAQALFLQKAQMILQCMTGNANFPTPVPDLKAFGDAISAYTAVLSNPASKANTALKKQLRANLTALIQQLALYVQMNGENDEIILLSSGFSLTKTRQPIGVLPKASNFKAASLRSCIIKLSNKRIYGADSYNYQYTTAPAVADSAWTTVNSTKANAVIENLTSGKQYAFRVAGIGTNPTVVYSDVITSYVL